MHFDIQKCNSSIALHCLANLLAHLPEFKKWNFSLEFTKTQKKFIKSNKEGKGSLNYHINPIKVKEKS